VEESLSGVEAAKMRAKKMQIPRCARNDNALNHNAGNDNVGGRREIQIEAPVVRAALRRPAREKLTR
jgi:hypothetical protein